jgi:acyl dehydratase
MTELFFEDFTVGRTFRTPGVTLTKGEVIDFALTYDTQPFHIDEEAARHTLYGGLIASGFQVLGLTFRMFLMTGAIKDCSLGGYGIDELRWHVPVRPGDTIRAEVEVVEQKPSASKPDRGQVKMLYRTFNQMGQLVQSFVGYHVMARRGGGTTAV